MFGAETSMNDAISNVTLLYRIPAVSFINTKLSKRLSSFFFIFPLTTFRELMDCAGPLPDL